MISIEKMTEADLPEVLAIEQASFSSPFSENLFRTELQLDVAHLYVVRSAEGTIIGYIDFWNVEGEIHIVTFAVHPDWRRKRIGSQLLESLIESAKKSNVQQIVLDVRPSNQSALGLYQKYGFHQIGERKKYYQDNGEDAWVLSLTIPSPSSTV